MRENINAVLFLNENFICIDKIDHFYNKNIFFSDKKIDLCFFFPSNKWEETAAKFTIKKKGRYHICGCEQNRLNIIILAKLKWYRGEKTKQSPWQMCSDFVVPNFEMLSSWIDIFRSAN